MDHDDEIIATHIRMTRSLDMRIDSASTASGRSKNAEMVMRLVDSFVVETRPLVSYSDGDLIRELIDRYPRGSVKIEIK